MNLRGRLLNRRILVSTLAWIVGACAAIVVAMLALSLIGDGLGTGAALSLSADSAAPERALPTSAAQPPTTPAAAPRRSAAPATPRRFARTPVAVTRLLSSSGGTAVARCVADRVYLVSWSPAQGYRADEVGRGPGRLARVSFESDRREVTIEAHCAHGTPEGRVVVGWNEPRWGTSPTPSPTSGDDGGATAYPTRGDR